MGARLLSTGVEGLARVNAVTGPLQPYAVAGVGWRRYDLTNADFNTSAVTDQDDLVEFPMGVGIAWRLHGAILDVRGVVRLATGADLIARGSDGSQPSMHTWDLGMRAGWEF